MAQTAVEPASQLDRESRFRRLMRVLEGPVSARWALVEAESFLSELPPGKPEAESYLLPLIEPLAERAEGLDPVGLPPSLLASLADRVRSFRVEHPPLRGLEAARRAETSARRGAALLFGYAGAPEAAARQLGAAAEANSASEGGVEGERPQAAVEELLPAEPGPGEERHRSPRERLGRARESVGNPVLKAEFRRLEEQWPREQTRTHESWVPVLERLPSWASGPDLQPRDVGALCRVGVELYGFVPSDADVDGSGTDSLEGDRLDIDASAGAQGNGGVVGPPARAVRRLLNREGPALRKKRARGRVDFGQGEARHHGRSADLAIAACFYGAALRQGRCRRRASLRPEVALTGTLTEEGAVGRVDEQSLPVKVRTAFFSPKTRLVVPEAQRPAAEAARDRLREEFPHGTLTIVGAGRLEELFYDRRLTRTKHLGWARHTAQRLWDRRGQVAASVLIAGLLVVIAALLYGPLDKNPVTVDFAGTEMILKNKGGRVLERIPVGQKTVQSAQSNNFHAYRLGDIDGNGQNEVCWSRRKTKGLDRGRLIQCKGVGEDTVRWSLETRFEVPFPKKPAVSSETFHPEHLRIGDFDANGPPELIATLRHNKYFPYLVLKLDAATGRTLGRYLHPGFFYSAPQLADLDGNGTKEVLLAGVNNAYDQAVFTVLDSRYIDGHGPTRGDYIVEGAAPAREMLYLRIPPTIVDRAQPGVVNKGMRINLSGKGARVLVEVLDGKLPTSGDRASRVLIRLNRRFEPVAVGTSSQYDHLSEWLVKQDRIDAVPDYDYFQRYKRQFLYWTGSGWAGTPTVNARWRNAAGTDWTPDTLGSSHASSDEAPSVH